MEIATNNLAYILAQTIYTAAITVGSTEASSIVTSSKNQRAEALRTINEAQSYFQSKIASLYLESKIQIVNQLDPSLSEEESVDLLIEASQIILAQ